MALVVETLQGKGANFVVPALPFVLPALLLFACSTFLPALLFCLLYFSFACSRTVEQTALADEEKNDFDGLGFSKISRMSFST